MSLLVNQLSDNEIVTLCQEGKLDHFGVLYDRYIDAIYKFIYLKTFDRELSEDITSDVFFKILNKIDTFKLDGTASFKTWAYTIAQNTLIDFFRTKKESSSLEEIVESVSRDHDFAQDIDNKDKLSSILAFLETQSPKTKEILVMRFWDDLSFKEIAHITGESVDNCKKIVSRTLKKLDGNTLVLLLICLSYLF